MGEMPKRPPPTSVPGPGRKTHTPIWPPSTFCWLALVLLLSIVVATFAALALGPR